MASEERWRCGRDGDGIPTATTVNTPQLRTCRVDSDGDGVGDDPRAEPGRTDTDGDGVIDVRRTTARRMEGGPDEDGIGRRAIRRRESTTGDDDGDGVTNENDNCRRHVQSGSGRLAMATASATCATRLRAVAHLDPDRQRGLHVHDAGSTGEDIVLEDLSGFETFDLYARLDGAFSLAAIDSAAMNSDGSFTNAGVMLTMGMFYEHASGLSSNLEPGQAAIDSTPCLAFDSFMLRPGGERLSGVRRGRERVRDDDQHLRAVPAALPCVEYGPAARIERRGVVRPCAAGERAREFGRDGRTGADDRHGRAARGDGEPAACRAVASRAVNACMHCCCSIARLSRAHWNPSRASATAPRSSEPVYSDARVRRCAMRADAMRRHR